MNKVPGKIYATVKRSIVYHPKGKIVTRRIYYTGVLLGICDAWYNLTGEFLYEICSIPESEVK